MTVRFGSWTLGYVQEAEALFLGSLGLGGGRRVWRSAMRAFEELANRVERPKNRRGLCRIGIHREGPKEIVGHLKIWPCLRCEAVLGMNVSHDLGPNGCKAPGCEFKCTTKRHYRGYPNPAKQGERCPKCNRIVGAA